MTQNASHEPDGASAAYLAGLRARLTADGCTVTDSEWRGCPVVAAHRADRRARWFGTKAELFVLAAAVPQADVAALEGFTLWAMERAKSLRGGIPGARNVTLVLPALVSARVQPEAAQWAAHDARTVDSTVVSRPVTVECGRGVSRTTLYRGRVVWGGLFTKHVLEKAGRYFT
ncbi:hypothetical protein [Streptomyces omiyaensis]|uniref:Uncharacterized protein n=1 Tax=Streptomyces omiyaensis TaxID=68247 RepID=A0ABW7BUD2_9ACTN|nr:hypothetical protein [Streptomyces omiyaensis]GGY51254.1 hypothetical protein GCM10010363_35310 [Streptomyces omiyaensis]